MCVRVCACVNEVVCACVSTELLLVSISCACEYELISYYALCIIMSVCVCMSWDVYICACHVEKLISCPTHMCTFVLCM